MSRQNDPRSEATRDPDTSLARRLKPRPEFIDAPPGAAELEARRDKTYDARRRSAQARMGAVVGAAGIIAAAGSAIRFGDTIGDDVMVVAAAIAGIGAMLTLLRARPPLDREGIRWFARNRGFVHQVTGRTYVAMRWWHRPARRRLSPLLSGRARSSGSSGVPRMVHVGWAGMRSFQPQRHSVTGLCACTPTSGDAPRFELVPVRGRDRLLRYVIRGRSAVLAGTYVMRAPRADREKMLVLLDSALATQLRRRLVPTEQIELQLRGSRVRTWPFGQEGYGQLATALHLVCNGSTLTARIPSPRSVLDDPIALDLLELLLAAVLDAADLVGGPPHPAALHGERERDDPAHPRA